MTIRYFTKCSYDNPYEIYIGASESQRGTDYYLERGYHEVTHREFIKAWALRDEFAMLRLRQQCLQAEDAPASITNKTDDQSMFIG